ncbi:N-carbamoyl-L-amino-acid hydrolase [Flaviramulus basaltis]|uniref:N-carbamoyl-L-amino-acid hydrolase n=1 Tax=Flaviramulus basaltis TaxID=369401 RepID=A0A1K2IAB3_9FLAO|nr:M20 family metallo-hydrolase [Flaviramulus basaltis]SFZ89349.1 N-carbamoyl-L-amino-acid hydrolase [Flaviramulus basaltis]
MQRLHEELDKLARFSSSEYPSVTRVLYTQNDLEARQYFISLCEDLNLKVRIDPIGNTYARWEGAEPKLAAIGTGSHIDAIPLSGQYDGTVGVFGALEAIRYLKSINFKPKRSIELVLFTAEEPTRFAIGCLGSRMMSGQLKLEQALKLKDKEGNFLNDVRIEAGFKGDLNEVELSKDYYHAFIELHIEQGPRLEKEGLDIGIVSKIAAPSTLRVNLIGEGGHAGAVLMPIRKDAGIAGAEIMIAVERIAKKSNSDDTVGTTGIFDILPRAVNSIPKEAYLEIDLRDTNIETRDKALSDLKQEIAEICEKRNIKYSIEILNCDPPAICDSQLVNTIEKVTNSLGYSSKIMASHAYHDSLFMAQLFPTTMIFIPSKDGVSHRPDEYSSPEQIEKGVKTLALTLKEIDG